MTGYEFSRTWFDFSFANPHKVKPNHTAIYFFAIERCNRLGWKEEFGFPTDLAMEALGIKNYKTYIRAIQDLVDWGFIKWIQKSKNQYTANIIALVKNNNAPPQALDKALSNHHTKQVRSTGQSIASIDKQGNNKPINLKTLNTKPLMEVKDFEVVPDQKLSFSWAIKFQELFLKNLKNKGAPLKKIKEVGYEDFVEPIRKMIENDGITVAHLQLAYELLQKDEFWNGIILDTNKLREKIGQLIAQGKMPVKIKEMDIRVQDKIKSYD
ncbi:hypothetical protein [Gillisia limnaea]|uniref:Uncharacterized protein n=1 Tax=Gillisia limnaea (strain DSM 15749 / LMG 21470 / R-8282) TaxID=865937 RepID=H2BXM1_GILLR|nr:hypothetical protein [Gillisia limnaea]EHQ03145.1 hypothetical protein Gilli_2523 [Gillisia limnaea DSM 15749]